jgi:RNA polymerase sigma-70 factor (ECF subfamily)
MNALDDSRIVELYLSRDESAISLTSEKYGKRLRAIAYGIVNDPQTAEECENDTYLQAWNSIPPQEPRAHFFGYLAQIIRRLSIDLCRHRSRLKRSAHIVTLTAELERCIPAPDDTPCRMEASELAKIISDFLAVLPRQQRLIFLRRYWYLDSIADISLRFSISQSKVKTTLWRTRNALREHLEEEGYTL